jgi:cell fate regulator YaaT (PSP1 superfamily)
MMGSKYVVRYGSIRTLGHFQATGTESYARGARIVIRSERGLEIGDVLCEATERTGSLLPEPKSGQVLRCVTRIQQGQRTEFDTARRFAADRKLQMELVDIEHLFGGERIVLYYLAEKRVDFRELVKALASEFQTRIEMRQIGVRDEAKLLADYGDCGKPVCCNTHLSAMPPVSMKMAKIQKSTLDPTKISGRCGRLKCCLRYEFETYEELQRELPSVGSRVVTRMGTGHVLAQEILAGRVLVEFEDRRRIPVTVAEVLSVLGAGSRAPQGGSDRPR